MRVTDRSIFSFEGTSHSLRQNSPGNYSLQAGKCILCLLGILLGLTPFTIANVEAAVQADTRATADIDSRWLPWIGSWRLVPGAVGAAEEKESSDYVLSIRPGDNRNTATMKAFRDKALLFDDTVMADGLSQTLKEKDCSGWYQYSWSKTGKRLLFESKSSCSGESPQKISGLWIVNKYGEWLDIQLLQRDEDRIITLRRYSPVTEDSEDPAEFPVGRIRNSRISAGTAFSVDEVIELSRKVAPEILEAALVEYHEPFPINSRTLAELSNAGVPPQVMDLMVALSFPEKFTVERHTVSITPKSGSGEHGGYNYQTYYIVDPFFPWCWTPYTWSFYWGYGGWGYGWGWYPPYYPGHPIVKPANSGRLVAGRGYTRVNPRSSSTAKPRSAGSGSPVVARGSRSVARPNARVYSTGNSSGTVSSSSTARSSRVASPPVSSSRGSSVSSGGGRVSAPSSGGSSSSASPRGYSGGSGGHTAKQR